MEKTEVSDVLKKSEVKTTVTVYLSVPCAENRIDAMQINCRMG